MLKFESIGKLPDSDAWAIKVFDEPFDTENGTMIIINSIQFVDETEEVSVDYQSDFPDVMAVESWLGLFVQEALESAITRAEELVSGQDTQTNQTP